MNNNASWSWNPLLIRSSVSRIYNCPQYAKFIKSCSNQLMNPNGIIERGRGEIKETFAKYLQFYRLEVIGNF